MLELLIEKLPEPKRGPLRELLQSLLEPVDKLHEHRESLERMEQKYLRALQEDSNVVDFRPTADKPTIPALKKENRKSLKVPCVIEASNQGEIFRMAFELHMRSLRSIFLSWSDIDRVGRLQPDSLMELSSCTLFIPNIENLSLVEQMAILTVLHNDVNDKPHFIAGSFVPYAELLKVDSLNRDFLEAISQAYLKLSKPVAQYKREGLIRYFIESLS